MWGTYGYNHAGACIEFHSADGTSNFSNHLMPVLYADRKMPICPSELMTERLGIDQWMLGVFLLYQAPSSAGTNKNGAYLCSQIVIRVPRTESFHSRGAA
jgi:hypothetical protein